MATQAKRTKNHDKIRQWAEKRGGEPATVEGTAKDRHAGLLRIEFPGGRNPKAHQSLKKIPWDEFFRKFDEKDLVFLYQDKTASGKPSRFAKFVSSKPTRESRH